MLHVSKLQRGGSASGRIALLAVACFATSFGLACGGSEPELPSIGGAAPESGAISWIRRFAMDRVLDHAVWNEAAAGFVALVAREGHVAFGRTTGSADVAAHVPMQLETRFEIASMTKPITAVAAMILVEEGRLDLEDRVDRYLPFFSDLRVATGPDADGGFKTEPLAQPILLRHLLTFTSGLGGYGRSDDPLDLAWRARDIEAAGLGTLAQRIERIAGLPLYEQPGGRWRYGWSFDVLARVVEIAAGEPYDAFLERRIFAPLGMHSTAFPDALPADAPSASMYTHDPDGVLVREPRFDAWYGRGWTPGGGGLVSTAPDYLRFASMLANGGSLGGVRILAPETVAQMTRLQVPDGVLADMQIEGLGWGLGLCVVADARKTPMRDTNGDFWWSGRFGSHFWISPASRTVVVVMQQTERSATSGRPVTASLVQAIALP